MAKLSRHYRDDDAEGINQEIKNYLDNHFLKNTLNINVSNPKFLVVFSGGNAVGKTTIARRIAQEFHAIVLENDAVKRTLLSKAPGLSRDELNVMTWQYTMNLYDRLDEVTPNGFVVRDGIIDWYFDKILPIFEKQMYELFIIGFDISREKSIDLIRTRGDTPTVKVERFYKLLDDHKVHTKRFRSRYTPDVMLNDSNIFDHTFVIDKIRKRLNKLHS